jgi:hypothetical protein
LNPAGKAKKFYLLIHYRFLNPPAPNVIKSLHRLSSFGFVVVPVVKKAGRRLSDFDAHTCPEGGAAEGEPG